MIVVWALTCSHNIWFRAKQHSPLSVIYHSLKGGCEVKTTLASFQALHASIQLNNVLKSFVASKSVYSITHVSLILLSLSC